MASPIRIARQLRKQMTEEEKLLWAMLRNRNLCLVKFRRQHPFVYDTRGFQQYFYVADFYCAAYKLIIELDGKHHEFGEQKAYDKARDHILKGMGLKIIRISNTEIRNNLNGVLDMIMKYVE
jgi:very-short-patch-repair endonuclease